MIDVQALGGPAAFASGLGRLLESPDVRKITFDCRADSDALWHQFRVRLTNVLDVQVFEQAVRIANGEALPKRTSRYGRPFLPFVKGMAYMSEKYLPRDKMRHLGGTMDNGEYFFMPPRAGPFPCRVRSPIPVPCACAGPHKTDELVWQKRPLSDANIAYAAFDAHIISELLSCFRERKVPAELMHGVNEHSARYTGHLRDRATEAKFHTDKDFIMEELPIISEATWLSMRAELERLAADQRKVEAAAYRGDDRVYDYDDRDYYDDDRDDDDDDRDDDDDDRDY